MIRETTSFRESALIGRLAFLNTGIANAAHVEVYGGSKPASVNDAPGSTRLVMIELQNPAGTVDGGALELLPVDAALITSSGIATWARVRNRDNEVAFDMDAGLVGSGAECELSQVELYAGGLVSLVSAVLG